jgi:hypothetical protein
MNWLKTIVISATLFFTYAFVWGGTYKNEPNGFRGIKWGTDVTSLRDMVLLKDLGEIRTYSKTKDALTVGDANAESIKYSFLDGKFYQVEISIYGTENIGAFKKRLIVLFGEPKLSQRTIANTDFEVYTWKGDSTEIDFVCSTDRSPPMTLFGVITMASAEFRKAEMNKVEQKRLSDEEQIGWKVFWESETFISYYHTKSVISPSKGIFRIWDQTFLKGDGLILFGERWVDSKIITVNGNEERCLWEIDCSQRMYRKMECDFFNKGVVVGSTRDLGVVPQVEASKEWKHIAPETGIENLLKLVCP